MLWTILSFAFCSVQAFNWDESSGKKSESAPYAFFDDFGAFYKRFAGPSHLSNVHISPEQEKFEDIVADMNCKSFALKILNNQVLFVEKSLSSHANQIRALTSLLFHSARCPNREAKEGLMAVLDGLLSDSPRFQGYFQTGDGGYIPYIVELLKVLAGENAYSEMLNGLVQTDLKALEYMVHARLLLMLALEEEDYGLALDGLKDILSQRPGVNPTPDLAHFVSLLYYSAFDGKSGGTDKRQLLTLHIHDLQINGFHDLLAIVASNLENSMDALEIAQLILGDAFELRLSPIALFPPFSLPVSPLLLHSPITDDPQAGMFIHEIDPKSVTLEWRSAGGQRRSMEAFLQDYTFTQMSSHQTSIFLIREHRGRWHVRFIPAGACQQPFGPDSLVQKMHCRTIVELDADDILVFVDDSHVMADDIKALLIHRQSLKETALLLQAALHDLHVMHHVMLLI